MIVVKECFQMGSLNNDTVAYKITTFIDSDKLAVEIAYDPIDQKRFGWMNHGVYKAMNLADSIYEIHKELIANKAWTTLEKFLNTTFATNSERVFFDTTRMFWDSTRHLGLKIDGFRTKTKILQYVDMKRSNHEQSKACDPVHYEIRKTPGKESSHLRLSIDFDPSDIPGNRECIGFYEDAVLLSTAAEVLCKRLVTTKRWTTLARVLETDFKFEENRTFWNSFTNRWITATPDTDRSKETDRENNKSYVNRLKMEKDVSFRPLDWKVTEAPSEKGPSDIRLSVHFAREDQSEDMNPGVYAVGSTFSFLVNRCYELLVERQKWATLEQLLATDFVWNKYRTYWVSSQEKFVEAGSGSVFAYFNEREKNARHVAKLKEQAAKQTERAKTTIYPLNWCIEQINSSWLVGVELDREELYKKTNEGRVLPSTLRESSSYYLGAFEAARNKLIAEELWATLERFLATDFTFNTQRCFWNSHTKTMNNYASSSKMFSDYNDPTLNAIYVSNLKFEAMKNKEQKKDVQVVYAGKITDRPEKQCCVAATSQTFMCSVAEACRLEKLRGPLHYEIGSHTWGIDLTTVLDARDFCATHQKSTKTFCLTIRDSGVSGAIKKLHAWLKENKLSHTLERYSQTTFMFNKMEYHYIEAEPKVLKSKSEPVLDLAEVTKEVFLERAREELRKFAEKTKWDVVSGSQWYSMGIQKFVPAAVRGPAVVFPTISAHGDMAWNAKCGELICKGDSPTSAFEALERHARTGVEARKEFIQEFGEKSVT